MGRSLQIQKQGGNWHHADFALEIQLDPARPRTKANYGESFPDVIMFILYNSGFCGIEIILYKYCLFQLSVTMMLPMLVIAKRQRSTMRTLIPFNSTKRHVPFPACFSRHVRTTSLPMLSFSEAGRLHQQKNTRCMSLVNAPPYDHPSGGIGKANTGGSPSRRCDAGEKNIDQSTNRPPAHQTGTAGWSRSLNVEGAKSHRQKPLEGSKNSQQSCSNHRLYNEMSLITTTVPRRLLLGHS